MEMELESKAQLKSVKVAVVNIRYKELAPTNLFVARILVLRGKAKWVENDKVIMLLKNQNQFKKLKEKIIREEKRICYICNKKIPNNEIATLDHVNSRRNFGSDERENLHCCCERCNNDKGNKNISDYVDHVLNDEEKYSYLNFNHMVKLKEQYKS